MKITAMLSATFILGVLPLGLMSTALAESQEQKHEKFPFSFNISTDKSVKISLNAKQQYEATLPNNAKQTLLGIDTELNSAPIEANVSIADYNFDGYSDIATYGGMGGMVNAAYNLYLWNPKQQKFSLFKGETTNLAFNSKHRLISSSFRSGPRWYETHYASDHGNLYKSIETAMVSVGSQEQGLIKLMNKQGKITKVVLMAIDDLDIENINKAAPVKTQIKAEKAFLYEQPQDSAKTSMYVIAGDSVILKNLAGIEADTAQWCQVEYKGKKTLTKWLKCEAL